MFNKPANQKKKKKKFTEFSVNSSSKDSRSGFIPITKRGTGYVFNESAVKRFLSLNAFSHIICRNEVTTNAFGIYFSGKCLTVFSCSHLSDSNKDSAVVLVDEEKIRIIRLDFTKPST